MKVAELEKTGLAERHIVLLQNILSRHARVSAARIFGSRATGSHKPGSDIDIVLFGDVEAAECALIKTEISDTTIPYFTDILIFDKITNSALVEKIENESILIYTKEQANQRADAHRTE